MKALTYASGFVVLAIAAIAALVIGLAFASGSCW